MTGADARVERVVEEAERFNPLQRSILRLLMEEREHGLYVPFLEARLERPLPELVDQLADLERRGVVENHPPLMLFENMLPRLSRCVLTELGEDIARREHPGRAQVSGSSR
ncbi:hypothetical protein L0Y59_01300 [Candidatus Uhrbacteria bacterium]|nr:hypothetical protein [Candidatus Uhrbacteria bacterium]